MRKLLKHILKYAGMLTLSEGLSQSRLRLMGCQHKVSVFGWPPLAIADGNGRDISQYPAARQNEWKMALYQALTLQGFSGYTRQAIYAATKSGNPVLRREEMSKFITADFDLASFSILKITYKSLIQAKQTECSIEALSREGGLDDGFRSTISTSALTNCISKRITAYTRRFITAHGRSRNACFYDFGQGART